MSRKIRTRFAPSPTGPLHMGGVRTALYCYLFAKKNNGDFILRVEDTDQTRFVEGAEEYIIETLQWCGIKPNEGLSYGGDFGPYRQSERKDIYAKYAMDLLEKGDAYYAFDTPEELTAWRDNLKGQGNPSPKYDPITRQYLKNSLHLSEDEVSRRLKAGEPWVIRYKMPRNEEVKFEDEIRGIVSFQTNQLDDKVLLKSDGMPTYHLANVVDDHLMEITHVIRGEEWLPSTPLHVLLYKSFEWEMPSFAHLPLILKPDGKGKLSKRDGDRLGFPVFPLNWKDPSSGEASIGYKERGFLPDAFINMLAFLGWNPGTEEELFSLGELIQAFSIERVGKSGARFDFEKTKWFNQQYIKNKSNEELVQLTADLFKKEDYRADQETLLNICELVKERATFLHEIPSLAYYFFEDVKEYDEKNLRKKWKNENSEAFKQLLSSLSDLENFKSEAIEKLVKDFMEKFSLGFGQVLPILRISITGTMQGPPIFAVMEVLGKTNCLNRLQKGVTLAMKLQA
jgi:glutamyl-tRNA synthetase|tara:strand:+ start:13464 stop:14996 length:1533 start_codon:yes stop_codon:yes gene_type:complete